MKTTQSTLSGILIIDKPSGITSHDVVDVVRKKFSIKKVGHAGTLDPMATGVLVMLIGKATKLSASLTAHDKEYECVMTLGSATDTEDATGMVTERKDISELTVTPDAIEKAFAGFRGTIEQLPPMHSALKHKGTPLYKLARKGITVERKPRVIEVKELEILEQVLPDVRFRIACSKGTYVRSLCVDIGKALGVPAHMSYLRRLRSGPFSLERALTLDELAALPVEKIWGEYIFDIESF